MVCLLIIYNYGILGTGWRTEEKVQLIKNGRFNVAANMGVLALRRFPASGFVSLVAVKLLRVEFLEKVMKLKYFVRKQYVARQAMYE